MKKQELQQIIKEEIKMVLKEDATGNNFMQHFSNYKGTEVYNVVKDLYTAITSRQVEPNQLADMILDLIDAAAAAEREDNYDF